MTKEVKKELEKIKKKCNWTIINKDNWSNISCHQELSEDFIREFKNQVDWYNISSHQKLSEEFIREFQDRVWWYNISYKQKLSEDFVREFKNSVDWFSISCYQKLSFLFIHRFRNELNIEELIERGLVTQEYLDKMDRLVIPDENRRYEYMDI